MAVSGDELLIYVLEDQCLQNVWAVPKSTSQKVVQVGGGRRERTLYHSEALSWFLTRQPSLKQLHRLLWLVIGSLQFNKC